MDRTRAVTNATLLSLALALSICAMVPDYGAPAYPYAYNGYADYPWIFGYGPPFLTRIGGIFATPEVAVVSFGALASTSDG